MRQLKASEESERVSDTGGRTSGTKKERETGGMVANYNSSVQYS